MTGVTSYPAHAEACVAWLTLKPDGSCSSPMTITSFALRAAAVLGTCAHACANGAAASFAVRVPAVEAGVAEAVAASKSTAATTAPTTDHRRLSIDSSFLLTATVIPSTIGDGSRGVFAQPEPECVAFSQSR